MYVLDTDMLTHLLFGHARVMDWNSQFPMRILLTQGRFHYA